MSQLAQLSMSIPDSKLLNAELRWLARCKTLAVWAALLGTSAVVLSPLIFMPLARDQGLFAYVGQVILQGGMPYRDVFEQKGPATHMTFAAVLYLGGETQLAVRGFFYLVALGSVGLGSALAWKLAGPWAAWATACVMSFALLQGDWGTPWQTAQVEDLLLLIALATLLLVVSGPKHLKSWHGWAWGSLWAWAVALKPTAVLPAAVLTVPVAWELLRHRGAKPLVRWLLASALGATAVALPLLAWLWRGGALEACWNQVVLHNWQVYARGYRKPYEALTMLLDPRWSRMELLALLALGYRRIRDCRLWRLLGWWLAAHYAVVIWQGKFWPYHWTPAVGILSIAAGVGVARMAQLVARACLGQVRSGTVALGIGGLGLLVGTVDVPSWVRTAKEVVRLWGHGELDLYRARFRVGAAPYEQTWPVAQYLAQHTAPGERIQVWGHECLIYFLSGRRAATRFAFNRTLCRRGHPRVEKWRREFLAQLAQNPPTYFVLVHQDGVPQFPRGSDRELEEFPELKRWLANHYKTERCYEYFTLLRHMRGGDKARKHKRL